MLPSLRSVYRYLMRHGYDKARLRAGRLETGPTHAFAAARPNELWMVDFSPGPCLRTDERSLRTHLCVIVDDCSRLIPFGGYYPKADTETFHHALKEAVQRRGLPRTLYTDNGKPFIGHHTRIVCATLGIRLLHAKPYHAWSKGKVERLIQTIQSGFETTLRLPGEKADSLDDLNAKLSRWIQAVYHQRAHSATGMSPEACFQRAGANLRRLAPDEDVERIFYTKVDRTVRKDGTIRLSRCLYEVPLSLRALTIELRFNPFTRQRIEVWHQGKFVSLATPVNLTLNHETGGAHAYEN
jgi:transposase InsO family protein